MRNVRFDIIEGVVSSNLLTRVTSLIYINNFRFEDHATVVSYGLVSRFGNEIDHKVAHAVYRVINIDVLEIRL